MAEFSWLAGDIGATLLSVAEAAEVAGRSPATIRRWVRDGRLSCVAGVETGRGGVTAMLIRRMDLDIALQSPSLGDPCYQSQIERDLQFLQKRVAAQTEELAELRRQVLWLYEHKDSVPNKKTPPVRQGRGSDYETRATKTGQTPRSDDDGAFW